MTRLTPRAGQSGFTLIELLIVVAIIGILAAIAVPSYQQYSNKAKFSEVVSATSSFKTGVELCIQNNNGDAQLCDSAGANRDTNVPASIGGSGLGKYVATVAAVDGVITATGSGSAPLSDQYVLTPTTSAAGVKWTVSGSCLTDSVCSQN